MDYNIIESIPKNFLTPCYVFDLDLLKARMELIQQELGDKVMVCYAMKANPFLIEPMDAYTGKYEVCSPGEYEICYRAGIHPEKIVVSGVNKTLDSMKRIMELSKGQGIFTIESEEHYHILSEICAIQKTDIRVLLRLSSGNQFGMDKENFEKVLLLANEDAHMTVEGLHYYSGTQKKMKKIEKELAFLEEYAGHIKNTYRIELNELEYGPGLSVAYFETDASLDAVEQLKELKSYLDQMSAYRKVTIEMGRFIASECGYYVTQIMDVKKTEDIHYAIVDGGIHQINYYGQLMGMKRPHLRYLRAKESQLEVEEEIPWTICGSLCTVNDVILKGAMLPTLSKGDCLVFEKCGAYSVTEGMALFLSRELPQIMFYSLENGFTVIRKMAETNFINSKDKKEKLL